MEIVIYTVIIMDLIFFTWHFLTLKYINPYTMDLYIGNKGCGKSSTIAKHVKNDIRKGIHTYVNADDININGVRIYDTFDLGHKKVTDAKIYVDEVSLFFDNRNFKNTSKEFIKWLREVRHNRLRVELYTQSYDCDKKIRTMCDNIYIGQRWFRVLTIWRRLRKNVAIKEEAMTAESQIVDELNFTPWFLPGSIKITYIPRYIKYFDSFKDLQDYKENIPYKKVKEGIEVRRKKNEIQSNTNYKNTKRNRDIRQKQAS